LKTHRTLWAVVAALMLALAFAACGEEKDEEGGGGGGDGASAQKDCGKVVLNEQAWAGSTANTYIAKAVLEDDLGCEVEITKITEIPVFQAMADGKVDAVLEDWQHTDEYAQYIDKAGTVVQGGPLGVEGHIGWFVPKFVMDENPEFKTWEGLKGKEDVFGNEFLGGDPSYVQKDKQLIEALGLDFKHVTAGAEPAQVARWSQAYKQKEPVIFYWYTPQYLNQEYDLAEVKLPPRTDANKDCKDDAKEGGDPEQYKCEYDVTIINKLFSKKFADSGSPAYDVLKKMKLTNDDQELVAKAIAGDKQDPEEAGADWVKDNRDKVDQWLE
jgi:glycine betaine/proline transport system substrate-binding protein